MLEINQKTGLNFVKSGSRFYSKTYLDGSPHHRKDKTFAFFSPKHDTWMIGEAGGETISVETWLRRYRGEDVARGVKPPEIVQVKRIFVSKSTMESTLPMNYKGNLYRFLSSVFGKKNTTWAMGMYNVGEDGISGAIFWYLNRVGKVCHDSIVPYGENGKRVKDQGGYRKYIIEHGYSGKCLFGEHLITKGKEVCVVESEKTALIMTLADLGRKNRVWVATGGANNLACVKPEHKKFPDFDAAGKFWECVGCEKSGGDTCIIQRDEKKRRFKAWGCVERDVNLVPWFSGLKVESGWDVGDYVLKIRGNYE